MAVTRLGSSGSNFPRGPSGMIERARAALTRVISPREAWDDRREGGRSLRSYAVRLYQTLAVFRFVTFAMGVGLFFAPLVSDRPPAGLGLLVAVVGLYNIARIVWPPDPTKHHRLIEGALLAGDIQFSILIVLFTGGLDSPFLIYSLTPILTAGLFIGGKSAFLSAFLSGVIVPLAHEASTFGWSGYPRLLDSNYLAFALLYFVVCLLVAGLPFLANLNWQRRQRSLAAESERSRLRREVHDDVAQTLAFLSLKMRRAEEGLGESRRTLTARDVQEISSVVRRSYVAVRDYLDNSGDSVMVDPLGSSLASTVEDWMASTGVPATLRISGEEPILDPEVKRHLLQIAREALANAGKHAPEASIWVELKFWPDQLQLRVRDSGSGLPQAKMSGHGLEIMRQRASIIGGDLSIRGREGNGTEVSLTYPVAGDAAKE